MGLAARSTSRALCTQRSSMRLDSIFYRLAYRFGKPAWDSGEPRPELKDLANGRQPGRALDLGCGTGDNVIFLSNKGWRVVGVDFVPQAVEMARRKARAAGASADFMVGDVADLRQAGVEGFDRVIDVGCYHAIPARLRDGYASGVAAVTRPALTSTSPGCQIRPGPGAH